MNKIFRTRSTLSLLTALWLLCGTFTSSCAAANGLPDITSVAKKAMPAVVFIQVKGKKPEMYMGRQNPGQGDYVDPFDYFSEDFFQRFFGAPRGAPRQPNGGESPIIGQGSGFIIDTNGHILTNNHVVRDSDSISVTLNDGREFPAKILGQDPNTDLALLKIEGKDLPYLQLDGVDDLEVGDWVIAIGNPLGLQASVTVGVVSAKGRNNLSIGDTLEDYIQTDAAINRGNSGGPLLSLKGKVVGINTAIATNTGGYMGIGFAIPSTMAENVVNQLLANGKVTRGFMGVILQKIDQELAFSFGLTRPLGALVAEVTKNSPAEKAELKQGDIIISYNGQQVENIGQLRNAISFMKPGSKVNLQIKRGKDTISKSVEIAPFPQKTEQAIAATSIIGISVGTALDDNKPGQPLEKGVQVIKVEPGSPAEMAGIRKGATIVSVNQIPVQTPEEFYSLIHESEGSGRVLLLVKQGNVMRYISLRMG